MKDLLIVGASGFGREIAWLVERINRETPTWNLLGFLDDNATIQGQDVNGYPVLGGSQDVVRYENAYVVCAVGASKVRKTIVEKICAVAPNIKFATLIDPSAKMSQTVSVGEGSIICAQTILTVNITVGKHCVLNLNCTVGHDAVLQNFATLHPNVNMSGTTEIGACSEMGTGSVIIQGKTVGSHTVVGAGSVVIKDIPEKCTAVGSPAKPIKFFD